MTSEGFLNFVWAFSPSDQISAKTFEGARTNLSIDVGQGVVTGVNVGLNNPTGSDPWVFTFGGSIGTGFTSPFGVGGHVNEGVTVLNSSIREAIRP